MFKILVSTKLRILSAISSCCVYLGIFLGCIPLHPPSLNFNREKCSQTVWKNVTFLYALIMTCLQPVLFIYMPQGLPESTLTESLSENIIIYTAFVVWAIAETIRRLFYLTHVSRILELIRKLGRQQVGVLSICKESAHGIGSLGATAFTCAYGIFAASQEALIAMEDPHVIRGPWIIRICAVFVHIGWLGSRLLATSLTLVAGQQLIEHYSIVMEDLSSHSQESELRVVSVGPATIHDLWVKGVKRNEDEEVKKNQSWRQVEKVKRLHENFDLYESVVGLLVLVALAENGMIGLVYIYKVIKEYEAEALFAVMEHYLSMILIAHLGQTMKDKLSEIRQNMKLILAKTELAMFEDESGAYADQYESKVAILQYICRWKWSFRACDMLDIGYTLFSVIAANTTMLVMFMFSLKISEQTAQ